MLAELELSYLEFTVLTATAFGARVLAPFFLGLLFAASERRPSFWRAGLAISTFPILWLVTDHFAWLFVLQVVLRASVGRPSSWPRCCPSSSASRPGARRAC
ncbi:MAG: hypothetical protein IPK00_24765 [Deltaproteobacteria bacterium]|nr:hypothetical protein [Deltaproteobacteria bacterium]